MKPRTITLPTGRRMRVPANIQRLDGRGLRGWQVRYHGTRYFADGAAGPKNSLKLAWAELNLRIYRHEAPTRLKHASQIGKLNGMPLGISGPVVRRRGTFLEASLMVTIPRFGQKQKRDTIYLGTENTYTAARYEAAMKRALAMRAKAVQVYRQQVTAARRAAA